MRGARGRVYTLMYTHAWVVVLALLPSHLNKVNFIDLGRRLDEPKIAFAKSRSTTDLWRPRCHD
jgi:hypothetical protein